MPRLEQNVLDHLDRPLPEEVIFPGLCAKLTRSQFMHNAGLSIFSYIDYGS